MARRGPDGAGLWISDDGRVGLAHRRLSIIDLAAAADQPMLNEDGSLRVVFNGEIYNHASIRSELLRIGGHIWRTDHSDTEVILHAFEEWGIAAIEKFRGMFAFALWDDRAKELWLVRDRLGVKPLYYSVHHGRLNFASEIKALLEDPDQDRRVNERALFNYLSFLAAPAPDTLFEGIRKLPNGHLLRIGLDGHVEERQWYEMLEHVVVNEEEREDVLCEAIIAELETSVALRKVSDVPVGVFLSGGIDSSTNVALFSERGKASNVNTFCVGYDQEYASYRNELDFASSVASRFGTDHHELRLTLSELQSFLPEMIALQDEPIADPVCFPLYFVSRLARERGVVVCQAGEGADELFFGYGNWRRKWRLQRFADQFLRPASASLAAVPLRLSGRLSKEQEALQRISSGRPVFWGTTEAFTDREKRMLLSRRVRESHKDYSSWHAIEPIWNRFQTKAADRSWMNWMTYLDLNSRLPELLLMRLDKMTMGVSLEGRVPFLDHKFVELVLGIPEHQKIGDGAELKRLLKRSVRGVIPDSVIDRPKQGFGVPVTEWMLGGLGDEVERTLTSFCDTTDFFDRRAVKELRERRDPRLWYLLNFAMWWQQYVD